MNLSMQSIPYFLSAILALGVMVLVWKYRRSSLGRTFILMMLAEFVWAAMVGVEANSTTLAANRFWTILSYFGVVSVPVLFFIFVLYFTGREGWLSRRNLYLLWVIPVITILMVVTNEWHHLHWSYLVPDLVQGEKLIYYGHGPWYYVVVVYFYVLTFTASLLLLQAVFNFGKAFRLQALVILLSVPLPWLGNLVYFMGISPWPGMDPAPIFFTLSGLIQSLAIFRFQLLDLAPVAREMIVEGLPEGIVVMDAQGRIVDLNPAADALLNLSGRSKLGQLGVDVIPQINLLTESPVVEFEFPDRAGQSRWLEYRQDPLSGRNGRMLGSVLTIRNITKRKQMELAFFDETQRLLKKTEQRAAELAAINTVSSALASELEVNALIKLVGEQTRAIFNADIIYVAFLDEASGTIRFPYTYGEDLSPVRYGEGLTSQIIQTNNLLPGTGS
jgi:PAS domain-containing protein